MAWVPTPQYMLRRHCVLQMAKAVPGRRVVEVGCGAGDLLLQLAQRGFSGIGVETSEAARTEARHLLRAVDDQMQVVDALPDETGQFDLLIACEVLEHIEDDTAALQQWARQLGSGGRMIISVPAHQKRWSDVDVWAGHFRRYERDDLRSLVTAATKLQIEALWSYGVPWANMMQWALIKHLGRRLRTEPGLATNARTARSGIERTPMQRRVAFLMRPLVLAPFAWSQRLFLKTDWGNGYLLMAKRVD